MPNLVNHSRPSELSFLVVSAWTVPTICMQSGEPSAQPKTRACVRWVLFPSLVGSNLIKNNALNSRRDKLAIVYSVY